MPYGEVGKSRDREHVSGALRPDLPAISCSGLGPCAAELRHGARAPATGEEHASCRPAGRGRRLRTFRTGRADDARQCWRHRQSRHHHRTGRRRPGRHRRQRQRRAASASGRPTSITDKPVRYVINTHEHPDHVFGNAAMPPGVTFVGHHNLPAELAKRGAYYLRSYRDQLGETAIAAVRIIPPTLLVDTETTLDLGDRRLRLTAWSPAAHTNCDLTVLDETTGVLFAGDLVFLQHVPVVDGSLTGWLAVLPRLAHVPAKIVVPGHGRAVASWPQALDDERRYLTVLAQDTRRLIAAGTPLARAVADIGSLGARPMAALRRLQCAQRDRGVQRAGMAVAPSRGTAPAIHVRGRWRATNPVRRAPASARDAVTVRTPGPSPPRHPRSPSPDSGIRQSRSRASRRTRHGSAIQSVPRNA